MPGATVWFCSDEHTTFAPDEPRSVKVGDRVRVLPAHVDPTVALHAGLHLVDGDDGRRDLAGRPARLVSRACPGTAPGT